MRQLTQKFGLVASALLFVGCVKSPPGQVTQLVKLKGPTFGGLLDKSFTAPSSPFALMGNCDANAIGLQWSTNNTTWTDVPGGCSLGTFTISVPIVSIVHVWVRGTRGAVITKSAHARIMMARPPTSESFQMVISGKAGQDDQLGTQNALETTFSKQEMTDGVSVLLRPSLIDSIYSSP